MNWPFLSVRLTFAILSVMLLLGAVIGFWLRRDPIRYENVREIKHEMLRADAVRLLGCQSGFYRTNRPGMIYTGIGTKRIEIRPAAFWESWRGNQGTIEIGFDTEGRVVSIRFERNNDVGPDPFALWWTYFRHDIVRGLTQ